MSRLKKETSHCNKIASKNALKNPDIILQIAEFLTDDELLIFRLV